MITLKEYKEKFPIQDNMYWKLDADEVIKEFEQIEEILNTKVNVINTHSSKSIMLPVIEFDLIKDKKSTITVSKNFYSTVVSYKGIPIHFESEHIFLTDMNTTVPSVYCYGFPYDKVYTCYKHNTQMFTFLLKGDIVEFIKYLANAPVVNLKTEDTPKYIIDPDLKCTEVLNLINKTNNQ